MDELVQRVQASLKNKSELVVLGFYKLKKSELKPGKSNFSAIFETTSLPNQQVYLSVRSSIKRPYIKKKLLSTTQFFEDISPLESLVSHNIGTASSNSSTEDNSTGSQKEIEELKAQLKKAREQTEFQIKKEVASTLERIDPIHRHAVLGKKALHEYKERNSAIIESVSKMISVNLEGKELLTLNDKLSQNATSQCSKAGQKPNNTRFQSSQNMTTAESVVKNQIMMEERMEKRSQGR